MNPEIKELYELDWKNENSPKSNPHAIYNATNDTILHVQDLFANYVKQDTLILDLGSGDGYYHNQFFSNYNFLGVDYIKKDFHSKNSYIIHNLNDYPYPNKIINRKYDCILTIETIEHLNRPDLFLENIYNLLAKDGYLILVTDNKDNIDDKLNNVDISLFNPRLKQYTKNRWTYGHIRYFNVPTLYSLLQDVGFKVNLMGGCGLSNSVIADKIIDTFNRYFNLNRTEMLKVLGYALPEYSPSIYVLAQKS